MNSVISHQSNYIQNRVASEKPSKLYSGTLPGKMKVAFIPRTSIKYSMPYDRIYNDLVGNTSNIKLEKSQS